MGNVQTPDQVPEFKPDPDFGLAYASKDGSICFEPVNTKIKGTSDWIVAYDWITFILISRLKGSAKSLRETLLRGLVASSDMDQDSINLVWEMFTA